MQKVSSIIEETISFFSKEIHADRNFDTLYRTVEIGGKLSCFYFIDGFVKDDIMEKMLEFFASIPEHDMVENCYEMLKKYMPYVEVGKEEDMDKIFQNYLSGVLCLFIDGFPFAITVDCRTYPQRSVEEPEKDKVLRGSRDGFVETVVMNTALLRRRIRSNHFAVEMFNVGERSKTDVVVCYMDDRVDQEFLKRVQERIQNIKVDALTMNQQSLAECLYKGKWYNPFPKFKYSERPDSASASILEGNIVILTDNSPAAMILPTSIFDIIEEADDYYFPPITGTYLRLSRFLITFITLILTPLWLLFMQNPQWLPDALQFIKVKEVVNVPLILQLLILEMAIDGLRLAALNTPSVLSTPLSVIAALVLGEFSVTSGWFNSETMLYMAFVAIANYTQASFELGYALKFMRILTLILTFMFHLGGFIAGQIITIAAIACNRTISGKSYLYPLIPFHKEQFIRRILRVQLPSESKKK